MSDTALPLIPIEEELERNGICVINTNGASMRPLLCAKDAVNIKKKDGGIKKYDVVLYKSPSGRYILHRVIGFKGGRYIIRGDNTYVKEYVPESDVIGCMVSYIKKGRVLSVSRFGYRLYSRLWNFIYPLRKIVRKIISIFKTKKNR